MVLIDELPDQNCKVQSNIYQRRAYAARRAMIAVDRYTAMAFTDKSALERDRALRWMKRWLAFVMKR